MIDEYGAVGEMRIEGREEGRPNYFQKAAALARCKSKIFLDLTW
jgi:hypothetical protein